MQKVSTASDSDNKLRSVNDMEQSLEQWAGIADTKLTLVFTDIVGSTRIGQAKGDELWINDLALHFAQRRAHANRYDGFVVKVIGDSFMIAFRTATQAIDFATDFTKNTGCDFIGIRVAIHSGDVRIMDNDIYGLQVNKTARIQSSIDAEGICVSDPIKDDYVKRRGSSSARLFSRHAKEIKNFPNSIVWLFCDDEIRIAQQKAVLARKKAMFRARFPTSSA